jgi:hypothetical protein
MKRHSLYIGGALLATTALSTSAFAGTVVNTTAAAATPATTYTARALSAQVFAATSPENTTLGPIGFLVNFTNKFTTAFDIEFESTNSDFTGSVAVTAISQPSTGTLRFLSSVGTTFTGCTVQVLTERILVEDCASTTTGIDALDFSSVSFNEANGLATAGTSLQITSGLVRGSNSNSTFELITTGTLATSRTSYGTVVTTPASANINNAATPPFSGIGTGTTQAASYQLGSVRVTSFAGIENNLIATSVITTANLTGGMEVTVTHGVLSDAATTSLDLSTLGASVSAASFVGNVASFNAVTAGNIGSSFDITVNFDGTTAISNWAAGTVDMVFTSAGADNLTVRAATSGTLGSMTRTGFSTQINTAQSSAGTGATLYQSLVRVTNNGTVAGTVSITLRDDADGSVYGTYTSESIEANSSIQISMPTIETALGITAAGQYQLGIAGAIDGYAQHVVFNSVDNLFVDLSGFRAANP